MVWYRRYLKVCMQSSNQYYHDWREAGDSRQGLGAAAAPSVPPWKPNGWNEEFSAQLHWKSQMPVLWCCCDLSRQGISDSDCHEFWDNEFGSFVFFWHKRRDNRKKGSENRFWFVYNVNRYGFGIYAFCNRMLGEHWKELFFFSFFFFFNWYFPCLVCLGWVHANDQILLMVRNASKLFCKL